MTTFEWIVSAYCILHFIYIPWAFYRDKRLITIQLRSLNLQCTEMELALAERRARS